MIRKATGDATMKKTIVWGFYQKSAAICIRELKHQGLIDVRVWIGEKDQCSDCTYDIHDFFKGNLPKDSYYGDGISIYHDVYMASLYKFMDMYTRRNFPFNDKDVHESLNMFNMLFDLFASLILRNDIDLVIFANMPHEGPDLVLYEVAKRLGAKTVLFYESLFPNRFFYMLDVGDFGSFNFMKNFTWSQSGNQPAVRIERKYEKKLFYMDDPIKGRLLRLMQKVSAGGTKLSNLTKRPIADAPQLVSQRLSRLIKKSTYRCNLTESCTQDIDLKRKFIYFPLHLQPELSTSSLGGIYSDQLLAIERLSTLLPNDWVIYIKENPKQTEFMRSQWFFDRMKLIKKAKMVPITFDTYSLIKHSAFVATISGTAGWEAITGGKPVLVFGRPWYMNLPGVFAYQEGLAVEAVVNYRIEHAELELKVNELLGNAGVGVIDPAYSVIVDDFDTTANADRLTTLLREILVRI